MKYLYLGQERTMIFNAGEGNAELIIDAYNRLITRLVVNEAPNKIGDAVALLLFENEKVQEALNNFMVDLIAGKLSFVNEIEPEALADSIATAVIDGLESIDWQTVLSDALEEALNGM